MKNGPSLEQFEELLEFLPLSEESICSYYPDRQSRYRAFRFDGTLAPAAHELVFDRGYRRCGTIYYAIGCSHCRACVPYRIPVQPFVASKSQRRVLMRNRDIRFTVDQPCLTDEKRQLFLDYSHHQHPYDPTSRDKQPRTTEELMETLEIQLYTNPDSTREFTMTLDDRLIGFGIFDLGRDTVSAVYNVYHPNLTRRSLGTFAVLATIEWARDNGYTWCNLGYYIAGHPKMDYKKRFLPAEVYNWQARQWLPMTAAEGDS